ncbi:MAG: LacI family DNA-binding transcriptional regulator [Aristaeellaceae bacterium]
MPPAHERYPQSPEPACLPLPHASDKPAFIITFFTALHKSQTGLATEISAGAEIPRYRISCCFCALDVSWRNKPFTRRSCRPTLKDVAKVAGVSTATVFHVLNGTKRLSTETTEKVLKVIKEMGYLPNNLAKSLRQGKTMLVGVLVEDTRGLPVPDIVCGIGDRLGEDGYKMCLYDLHLMGKLDNDNEDINFHRQQIEDGFSALQAARMDGLIWGCFKLVRIFHFSDSAHQKWHGYSTRLVGIRAVFYWKKVF